MRHCRWALLTGALFLPAVTVARFAPVRVIGLAAGVTSHLTLFARLPLARASVTTRLTLDSTSGNAGFQPRRSGFRDGGVIAGSGGRVQKTQAVRAGLRLYYRLFK